MVKINEYIESGILEAYLLGSASESEKKELLYLKAKHPQIQNALYHLETDMEYMAQMMAINPPPAVWNRIETEINELVKTPQFNALTVDDTPGRNNKKGHKSPDFIEVEGSSSHMRIHKLWRWVLLGIFILGKIFLAFAIYFYLQNRQQDDQIKQLKAEIELLKKH